MKLIDTHPDWVSASDSQIIDSIGSEAFKNLTQQTAEYYRKELPFPAILTYYGAGGVTDNDEKEKVCCKLVSHGGSDHTPSAQYFKFNRETGEVDPKFYCHKCERVLDAFWYVYAMCHEGRGMNLRQTLKFIGETFFVGLPKDLWFAYDSATFYLDDECKVREDPKLAFIAAERTTAIKKTDPIRYMKELKGILHGHDCGHG